MSSLTDALLVPIKIKNPFNEHIFPKTGVVYGYIDTGYTGFLIIPQDIYSNLKFDELKQYHYELHLPNGEHIDTRGTYGLLIFTDIGYEEEGFIETSNEIKEIILGLKALKTYEVIFDFCEKELHLKKCIYD